MSMSTQKQIDTPVEWDIDDRPSEVLSEILEDVKYGKRRLYNDGNAKIARNAFRGARKKNVKVIAAVQREFGLGEAEIQEAIGENVQDVNEHLKKLSQILAIRNIQRQREGMLEMSEEELARIEEVEYLLDLFMDLMEATEESQDEYDRSR